MKKICMQSVFKPSGFGIFFGLLPMLVYTGLVMAEIFMPYEIISPIYNENGLVELGQFAVITLAAITAGYALIREIQPTAALNNATSRYHLGLIAWFSLALLGCIYVAGEEISWGQHFLGWQSNEFWASVNDQGETNLHNTSSWLDQKPRLVLEIGVMIGGLAIPLIMALRPNLLPKQFQFIYPPARLCLLAFICLWVKISDKICQSIDLNCYARASEIVELFIFYYVLAYLCHLCFSRSKST